MLAREELREAALRVWRGSKSPRRGERRYEPDTSASAANNDCCRIEDVSHRRGVARVVAIATMIFSGCLPVADRPEGSAAAIPEEATTVAFAGIDEIHAELAARRRAGRPVLLNFWATWCGPCVEELPELATVSRDFAGGGLDVIGVSLDAWVIGTESETDARVRLTLARNGVDYPNLVYRGDQGPLLQAFSLPGPIPFSILYDGDGRTVKTWREQVGIAELRREVARLQR